MGGTFQYWPINRSNLWNTANTLAHELLGHAFDGITDDVDADEEGAMIPENAYHAVAGERHRDCYTNDDLSR